MKPRIKQQPKCSVCKKNLSYWNKSGLCGYHYVRIYNKSERGKKKRREWNENNKEKMKEKKRIYYLNHKEIWKKHKENVTPKEL